MSPMQFFLSASFLSPRVRDRNPLMVMTMAVLCGLAFPCDCWPASGHRLDFRLEIMQGDLCSDDCVECGLRQSTHLSLCLPVRQPAS